MVKTMYYLYQHYGSGNLAWSDLLNPAIKLATEGFSVGPFRAKVFHQYGNSLLENYPVTSPWIKEGGTIPEEGDTLRNLPLAETLKIIAKHPDDFYKGKIATAIASDMKANGGWITLEDLKNFPQPTVRPAINYRFQGHDVYSAPDPAAGATLFKMLEFLQQDSTKGSLAVIKALHQGHHWRALGPEMESGETTHFSVTDGTMSLAVTASINAYFGSKTAHPELGFLYNSYLTDFEFGDSQHWNALKPGKPAYSSMTPVIIRKNETDLLVMGSPGSQRIISTMAQLINHWVSDPQHENLLELSRIHAQDSTVWLETVDQVFEAQLQNYGYQVKYPSKALQQNGLNAYFGGVHALMKTEGHWRALADPRRDGQARNCSP
jgi:gamma-glutamyltranspeptidase/glutathione hydrolase